MYNYPDINENILSIGRKAENLLSDIFREIDDISEYNQYKVLSAFINNKVAESHFFSGSGYGYNETGREVLEKVYADIFHAEDALVRPQLTCGTHSLYLALSANLLPGDEILFVTGRPYDSLEKSIGIIPCENSLAENGITYNIVDLLPDGSFDMESIQNTISNKTKIVYFQRSKGYVNRPSISSSEMAKVFETVKEINRNIILFVDNCYGEFVEREEPTDFGADICVGSLIKNPGGGLAPTGGYIVGKKEFINRCANRLTAPGLGKDVGGALGTLKLLFQGLALAPKVVSESVKNAHFAAAMFEYFGYNTNPRSMQISHCIVEAIDLLSKENVEKFCAAIQSSSYVDSFVKPIGWDMPGYSDQVIMASGAFNNGSSIELSADGPLKEPYTVFFQGGLTYEQGKYSILKALQMILE